MIIKYNGPKPVKRLCWNSKDWGMMEYVFDPTCKVTDSEFAKFLLSPDRLGLFSIVEEKEGEVTHEAKKLDSPIKVQLEDQKPVKRGRPRKVRPKLGEENGPNPS